MIDLYYFMTPNGHKATIFLEEANLDYQIRLIDITRDQQFSPDFLAISPNNRIPAIVDHNPKITDQPVCLFESGAILEYLADKTNRFLPQQSTLQRYQVLQWLYWQVGGLGPMAGQNHHFQQFAKEKVPYAIERYSRETRRLYTVLNKQLEQREYIVDDYSIADMACYPWVARHPWQGIELNEFSNIERWFKKISERPAVKRAYEVAEKFMSK